jgi:hypothetical protein
VDEGEGETLLVVFVNAGRRLRVRGGGQKFGCGGAASHEGFWTDDTTTGRSGIIDGSDDEEFERNWLRKEKKVRFFKRTEGRGKGNAPSGKPCTARSYSSA